jgi:hypothetical protein
MGSYCLNAPAINALTFEQLLPWPERMRKLMRRLNVDPGMLARLRRGDALTEARTMCFFSGTSEKCLRWLDDPAQGDGRPEFCPNLALFEACKRDRIA